MDLGVAKFAAHLFTIIDIAAKASFIVDHSRHFREVLNHSQSLVATLVTQPIKQFSFKEGMMNLNINSS